MGTLRLKYKKKNVDDKWSFNTIKRKDFSKFSTSILGLGDIRKDAKSTNALAVVFDLEGFTDFCNQIDPQLVIPEFLDCFLSWLFQKIEESFTESIDKEVVTIWGSLPFFGKFTGDGALFLWDTDLSMGQSGIGNITISLRHICEKYQTEFYPKTSKEIAKVPKKLRVGIARGQVLSIGDNRDFVGPCINMASRLQKLGALSFAISRRGFNPKECFEKSRQKDYTTKQINIRGIGPNETVIILKNEYGQLSDQEKSLFT